MIPSAPLTLATAALIWARAWINPRSMGIPLIGKFSTARCVWARHLAPAGTRTTPIESCSIRNPSSGSAIDLSAPIRRLVRIDEADDGWDEVGQVAVVEVAQIALRYANELVDEDPMVHGLERLELGEPLGKLVPCSSR